MFAFTVPLNVILTAQAIIIWMIVFSATSPRWRVHKPAAVVIIIVSTLTAVFEVLFWGAHGLLVTSAVAGYGWGCLASRRIDQRLAAREQSYFNDDE